MRSTSDVGSGAGTHASRAGAGPSTGGASSARYLDAVTGRPSRSVRRPGGDHVGHAGDHGEQVGLLVEGTGPSTAQGLDAGPLVLGQHRVVAPARRQDALDEADDDGGPQRQAHRGGDRTHEQAVPLRTGGRRRGGQLPRHRPAQLAGVGDRGSGQLVEDGEAPQARGDGLARRQLVGRPRAVGGGRRRAQVAVEQRLGPRREARPRGRAGPAGIAAEVVVELGDERPERVGLVGVRAEVAGDRLGVGVGRPAGRPRRATSGPAGRAARPTPPARRPRRPAGTGRPTGRPGRAPPRRRATAPAPS